jgi:hypothetical protein
MNKQRHQTLDREEYKRMRRLPFLPPLVVLIVCALPAWAVDLTRIERTIANEPAYETKSPKYCLLVFGPDATMKVWLVVDGDALHVSNNEGDLTGAGSRRIVRANPSYGFSVGNVTDRDGKTKYTNLQVAQLQDAFRLSVARAGEGRPGQQQAGYDPANKLRFADRPQDAPIVHFGGPIEISMYGSKPTLERKPSEIRFGLGTPGLGEGTFAAFQGCACPEGARQGQITADIEFPKADAPGETIKVQTTLRNRH